MQWQSGLAIDLFFTRKKGLRFNKGFAEFSFIFRLMHKIGIFLNKEHNRINELRAFIFFCDLLEIYHTAIECSDVFNSSKRILKNS